MLHVYRFFDIFLAAVNIAFKLKVSIFLLISIHLTNVSSDNLVLFRKISPSLCISQFSLPFWLAVYYYFKEKLDVNRFLFFVIVSLVARYHAFTYE